MALNPSNTASPPLTDFASLSGVSLLMNDDEESGIVLAADGSSTTNSGYDGNGEEQQGGTNNSISIGDNNGGSYESKFGIPPEIRGKVKGGGQYGGPTSNKNNNNNLNGGTNNNNTPSPTRNNIQLEISTEDGGSMNIQREVTLENVSLTTTSTLICTNNAIRSTNNDAVGGMMMMQEEGMIDDKLIGGGGGVEDEMKFDGVKGRKIGCDTVTNDGKGIGTERVNDGNVNSDDDEVTDTTDYEGRGETTNNHNWNEGTDNGVLFHHHQGNIKADPDIEEDEEDNAYNNYLDTTSVITNSMSVITDVIDNYSSSIPGGGGGATTTSTLGRVTTTAATTSNNETSTTREEMGSTTTTTLLPDMNTTFQDAGNAVYDAVASFLSGGGGGGGDTTTTATTTNNNDGSTSNTNGVQTSNKEGIIIEPQQRRKRSVTAPPRRKSKTEVDMLTGLVLGGGNNDDEEEEEEGSREEVSTTTNSMMGTQSQKDDDDDDDNDGRLLLVNPPVSESVVNPVRIVSSEDVNVEGSQILVKKNMRESSEELEEEEGGETLSKKEQVVDHFVENKVEGGGHEDDDEDEVRNSNSDEYYYQNAHSHENHHHSHDGGGGVGNNNNDDDDDVREDSLVLDTLSSDWLPSVGPSGEDEDKEYEESRDGPFTLSAQNLFGTSVKSLMDGSWSSSADSSGEVVVPSNNLVQVTGGEFMDVPCRPRRKPQQGEGGGATQEMSSEGGSSIPATSTSTSSQDPLQCVPLSSTTSSSNAQRRSQYKKQGGDESSFNSDMMELQRGLPMSSPMAGDVSRNSDMMELQRGLPLPPGRAESIDESMNSRMMKLQPGLPMEGDASTNSDMMELQHGSPMSPDRSESPSDEGYRNADHHDIVHSPIRRRDEAIHTMAEALSLHHQHQPTPQSIIIDTKKPEIPDSYPSLMDALQSGSSFGSVTVATQSVGIALPNQTLHNNGREYIDHEAEEILNVQDEEDDEGRRENSLTYTEFYNTQKPLQGADQAAQAASLPPSSFPSLPSADGNADPRMDIDYQRHYIVDLQPINEEVTSTSRSGVTSGEHPPREDAGVNNNATENLHQVRQQQFRPQESQAAANLRQQQQYHPMAPAPHQPNDQFFNYRHQYYQEKYQDDNETAQSSRYDDDTDSTCSSVTLSQAFQGSDESSVGLNSSVSSITFSQVDQHEHDQGFFIATKLGDFVQVPNEVDISENDYDTLLPADADANLKTAEEEKHPTDQTSPTSETITADNTDEVSNTTAAPEKSKEDSQKQVGATSEDMASDLLASIVPECGVPIPSVMAKVGTRRRKSSNTGFLVPWHSSRSIQSYHFGNQRKNGGRQQRSSSNSSLFSIGSVHTFRG